MKVTAITPIERSEKNMKRYKRLFTEWDYEKVPLSKLLSITFIKSFFKKMEWDLERKSLHIDSNINQEHIEDFESVLIKFFCTPPNDIGGNLLGQTLQQMGPKEWEKFLDIYKKIVAQKYRY